MRILASKTVANIMVLVFTLYFSIAMIWTDAKLLDSPILVVLVSVFFINLLACTIRQILNKHTGYRWGLVVLHLGLVMFTIGYGIYHFSGGIGLRFLGEGQGTSLRAADLRGWQGGFLARNWDSGYTLTMKDINIIKTPKQVELESGIIQIKDERGNISEEKISFTKDLKFEDTRILVQERGFAPIVEWNGEVIYWSIFTKRENDKEIYKDYLLRDNIKLEGEFFAGGPDGKNGELHLEFAGDPMVHRLKPGETLEVKGQKITWQYTGYWMQISVHHEPGINLIWISSILIILGSTIYYIPHLWKRETDVI